MFLPIRVVIRSQQIAFGFSSYGLGGFLASLGLQMGRRGLGLAGVATGSSVSLDRVVGKRLARTFMRLGPSFIKLGQILATRPDLVGERISDELRILYDNVDPIAFAQILCTLKREIGKKKFKEWFGKIEEKALASASIGQTHRATLKDGTPIILKVQKPKAADLIKLDLVILGGWARAADLLYPRYQWLRMFRDFKEATERELDYREEARNMDRFRKNYRKLFADSEVVFPRYFPELTTERVIVMEPMHGLKIEQLRPGTTVARRVAAMGLGAILEQIFDHGFFHADPHAGNLFFLEEKGRIGFIDLGLVGRLETEDRRKFLKVLLGILKRDKEKLARALYDLGQPGKRTRYPKFEKQVCELVDEVGRMGVDKVNINGMVRKLLALAHRNQIHIPNRYVLMIRSCLAMEGVAKSLDPKISVMNIALPIVTKSLLKSYNPLRWLRRP